MRAVDIIARKRDGYSLTREEIDFFIHGFTRGDIPDYQASAWLMAVFLRGMDARETTDLTLAMAHSGETLDLSGIAPVVVDKHSTGGVGDKTTLVVGPMVAALGLPVGKMSGRGLGFSGGTLDKLESIPGLRVTLTKDEFLHQLKEVGLVIAGQSADLAPADGKLYALRDVTATVESLPLIASSIMSKKIAAGAHVIVLDVKVGRGAFMKSEDQAVALAQAMVEIGQSMNRKVAAVIADMDQPLGNTVGNALEVHEAISTLSGNGPRDLVEHCLAVASQMVLAGKTADPDDARRQLLATLGDGRALAKFQAMIHAQGGDPAVVVEPDRLPHARLVESVPAPRTGYIAAVDAMEVGLTAVDLGAGRLKKGDTIDPAVGIVLHAKIGDLVSQGQPLFTIHANNATLKDAARIRLLAAYRWSDEPVRPPPHIRRIITR